MNWLREYSVPILIAAVIHGAVLLGLSVSYDKKPKLPEVAPPKFIAAKTVQLKPEVAKQPKANQTKPIAAAKKQEQQKQQQLEQQRQKKLAQQRQERIKQERLQAERAAQEKKRLAALEKERAEMQKAEQQQLEQEKKRQEQLKKQQAEQRKAREEALAQAAREELLVKQLQDEMLREQQQAESEQEAQSYIAVIQQAVIANWSRPASARNGMEAILIVQLIPNGTVIEVKVEKSSGNDAFDRSAVAAVRKAERFPELAQVKPNTFEQYFRRFSMRFNPDDLRL